MIEMIRDTFVEKRDGLREVTFRYDSENNDDLKILENIMELLNTQKLCTNCVNYQNDGYFCGYCSHSCKIHGNIEAFNHPHHDGDGSKCDEYIKRKELQND